MIDRAEGPLAGEDEAYAREVGRRLRDVRRQQGLSLHQVSVRSGGAFSTSILGAYERGERSLSVARLSALAELYGIPTTHLLPQPEREAATPSAPAPVAIDLSRLASGDEWVLVRRYAASLQRQRRNAEGPVVSLRHEDVRIIARLYALPVEQLLDRLREDDVLR